MSTKVKGTCYCGDPVGEGVPTEFDMAKLGVAPDPKVAALVAASGHPGPWVHREFVESGVTVTIPQPPAPSPPVTEEVAALAAAEDAARAAYDAATAKVAAAVRARVAYERERAYGPTFISRVTGQVYDTADGAAAPRKWRKLLAVEEAADDELREAERVLDRARNQHSAAVERARKAWLAGQLEARSNGKAR